MILEEEDNVRFAQFLSHSPCVEPTSTSVTSGPPLDPTKNDPFFAVRAEPRLLRLRRTCSWSRSPGSSPQIRRTAPSVMSPRAQRRRTGDPCAERGALSHRCR